MSLQQHIKATAYGVVDPYFNQTVMLLQGNGSNGGQNSTFIDSSVNNFDVMPIGNVAPGTFSPFSSSEGRWSNYFDGTGDYLSGGSNSNLAIGATEDWTIECWVNFNSTGYGAWFQTTNNINAANGQIWFGYYTNGLTVSQHGSNTYMVSYSWTPSIGVWYHVAATRTSGTTRLFINGVVVTTSTLQNGLAFTQSGWATGVVSTPAYYNGYISNLRFVRGTSLYSGTFVPPTSPLTAITNTNLLTCQSNRFKDNSTNAADITLYGNASVTSLSPFASTAEYVAAINGGSGYFDGDDGYLLAFVSSALAVGTGAFTWECWFYPTIDLAADRTLFIMPTTNGIQIGTKDPTQGRKWGFATFGVAWRLETTTMPITGQWNHMAISRSGTGSNQAALFMNGTRILQGTIPDTLTYGTAYINSSAPYGPPGYISGMRFLVGTALYEPSSSSYTVPSTPMTAIANTQLLLNFTDANIRDSAAKNNLKTVGDAQISTSTKKFGTGSLKFDGTGNYLQGASSGSLNFGTGDFTVECWIYLNSTSSSQVIVGGTASNSFGLRYGTGFGANNGLNIYRSAVADLEYCSFTFSTGQWYHVAVVRSSSTIKFFVDGVQKTTQGSGGATYNYGAETNIRVGISDSAGEPFNGYIDDLRITKGVARYTANFTPPTRQLPAR